MASVCLRFTVISLPRRGRMEYKIITSIDEFYGLKHQWERLQEIDDEATIYSTFALAKAWCEAHRDCESMELFIICIFQGVDILGIAPFAIEHHNKWGLNYRELVFLGMGDFLTVLVDESKEDAMSIFRKIFTVVEENSSLWDKMSLNNIINNSKLGYFFLRSRKYNEHLGYSRYNLECPNLLFDKYESFDRYRDSLIPKSIKRNMKKLKEITDYDVEARSDKNVYELMARMHINEQEYLRKSKNRLDRKSLFADSRRAEFIRNVYGESDNLITFFLKSKNHDGSNIAYEACYIYKDVIHSWNSAYDPEFEKYGVGSVLSLEIIRYCFENKIAAKLDFGCGRYPWKFDFTDSFTSLYQLELWNEDTHKGRYMKRLSEIRTGISTVLGKNC
ncbi:hypothetical protein EAL2_c18850 [Peptoclostridium acidaminophilum DSM 3953]|uniref:BioF2-like acetyltransferase domain-containing protein n=2 Tax=Peptoclostridium acidaminophilum TaxID=1731 RepID=W8U8I3_PEPAC|nr:hypothetical protein EAL2_c18850 [Peptoclostridium acidaminophilum DSM 3953]